jgi:hypothetical protein
VLDILGILEGELRRTGVPLWLAGVPSAARPQLNQDELATTLGPDRIWHTVTDAVDHFQHLLAGSG